MSTGRADRGEGDHRAVVQAMRTAAVFSGLFAALAIAVLTIYIAYVYSLWGQALRTDGTPGAPPP